MLALKFELWTLSHLNPQFTSCIHGGGLMELSVTMHDFCTGACTKANKYIDFDHNLLDLGKNKKTHWYENSTNGSR